MINLFDVWNRKKQNIHQQQKRIHFNEGDIWWVQFGQNIGNEIFGKGRDFARPRLVIKKVFSNAVLIVPLSTKQKTGSYYTEFVDTAGNLQIASLHQIRYIDVRRFQHRVSRCRKQDLRKIKDALAALIK